MSVARTVAPGSERERSPAAAELQRFINAGRLASAVSHDLLSALGVAQTYLGFLCEILDEPARAHEQREAAEDARAAVSRAVSRVAAVLSLAREREGEIGPVDVKEVIGAALFDLDARLAGYAIVSDLQAAPFVRAQRGKLLQTVVSVLQDAVDCTPARGRIGISLRAEAGFVIVSVDDEGPAPIAPEVLPGQPESALWICRDAVQSFGGELIASAGQLGGKRITLRLRADRISP
jgi:C4-dicarboxylate-specific signal transduction histidine kinase